MNEIILSYTTDASGDATVNGTRSILGSVYAVEYQPGNTDTGATITITVESGVTSFPVLTKASAGTSNALFYPRQLVNKVEDGAALTGTSGGDRVPPAVNGIPRIVVSAGGNATSGLVILYYEDC